MIFFSLNSAACDDSSDSLPSPDEEIVVTDPVPAPLNESDFVIDELRFGMSPAAVERKLGKPTDIQASDWYEYGKNFGVHFRNGVSADILGSMDKNFGTPRGIFVGSTLAEIEKVYGTNYRRNESDGNDFVIGYSFGEKLLAFIIDGDTNRVATIMVIEDINTFTPPPKNSTSVEKTKQRQESKPPSNVNNKAVAEKVLKTFAVAFLNRDRAGMESCSFYEERNFTKEKGYAMLDNQIAVLDVANDVYRQTFGASWQYDCEIFTMDKINADTYEATVVFIFGGDTMSCSNVRVCNVGGRWLVDADSFALSTSLNFVNAIYSGY